MSHCTDTPVSWLRLEQLAIGDLGAADVASVRAHLEACDACTRSLESIESDRRVLTPLTLKPHRPAVSLDRLRRWLLGGGVALAAAAALLFLVLRGGGAPDSPALGNRVAIKGGGELVLSLVRLRGDSQTTEPRDFADGDRIKVALTCSETGAVPLDAVVIQSGELFRPLGESLEIRCGNNVMVPGAFAPTGSQPITVCVAPRVNRSKPLAIGALAGAACADLAPAP